MLTSQWPKNHVSRLSVFAFFAVLLTTFFLALFPVSAFAIPDWAPLTVEKAFDKNGFHEDYEDLTSETTFTASFRNPETGRDLVFVAEQRMFFGDFYGTIYYCCGEYDTTVGDLTDPGAIVDFSGVPILDLQAVLDDALSRFQEGFYLYEDELTLDNFSTSIVLSREYSAELHNMPSIILRLTEAPGTDYTTTYWIGSEGTEEIVGGLDLDSAPFAWGGTVEIRNFFKDPNAEPAGDSGGDEGTLDPKGDTGKEGEGSGSTTKKPPHAMPNPIYVNPVKNRPTPKPRPKATTVNPGTNVPRPAASQTARSMPATGDFASISMWMIMLLGSGTAISALRVRKK